MTKTDYTYEVQKQKRCTSEAFLWMTSDFEITHC